MFYAKNPDSAFRFGDIIQGFALSSSCINEPSRDFSEFDIKIINPKYSVILTPCCSIRNKKIALTPLLQIIPSFFDNPYFCQDLTNINREMKPELAIPPKE